MKVHDIFFLLLLIINFNCNDIEERPYSKKLGNITYGEIHLLGSILSIAIEDYNKFSLDTIIKFAYCLKEKNEANGMNVSLIKIYKYYYYVDQLKPADLLLLVHFKFDLNPYIRPTNQIILVEKVEQDKFKSIPIDSFNTVYHCNSE